MIDKFQDYLRLERNYSMRTVDEYGKDLRQFESYFTSLESGLSWAEVDSDIIRGWMESMIDRGNTATSVKQRLSAVRSFYRFLLFKGWVSSDPSRGVENPKTPKPLPTFVKEKDMERLLDLQMWGDDYRDVLTHTILVILYDTGVRASELIRLNLGDVDMARMEVRVTGKRNKQRVLPFGDDMRSAIERYLVARSRLSVVDDSEALLLTVKGRRLDYFQLRRIVRDALGRVTAQKKRSPHVLRHTFATAMLNHDAALQGVQKLLGHESMATTEIYTHTTFERVRRVYKTAHPRG